VRVGDKVAVLVAVRVGVIVLEGVSLGNDAEVSVSVWVVVGVSETVGVQVGV
jgi:uncharacterized protein (DUF983 family)